VRPDHSELSSVRFPLYNDYNVVTPFLAQLAVGEAGQMLRGTSPHGGLSSSPSYKAGQRKIDQTECHSSPSNVGPFHPAPTLRTTNPAATFQLTNQLASESPITRTHAPQRLVRGIELLSTHELPDRFRSVFKWPNFNAIQSKCFPIVYRTNDNFVLSSPTGSGKTVIFELAILRVINGFQNGQYKIVYQAPTKSLCAERHRDWQMKFKPFGIDCAELTGDTEQNQLRSVQKAAIIITTPEKWDSMTRKWKDHAKLIQMVKLFLIDEVHMLKEERGATLEAVVSRMKSVGSDVRFVALSATVPNSEDIATWLGKDPMHQHIQAPRERFGEEFRPVRLQKHVIGYQTTRNEFALEGLFDQKSVDPHVYFEPVLTKVQVAGSH
jgi:ATP-dependent DNA helicase HFM1/MER3